MESFYVGHIEVGERVAAKIQEKHGVSVQEVRDAARGKMRGRWVADRAGVERLLLVVPGDHGRLLKVILWPVDVTDGTWRLATALVARAGRNT